jgi:hypothetical protein
MLRLSALTILIVATGVTRAQETTAGSASELIDNSWEGQLRQSAHVDVPKHYACENGHWVRAEEIPMVHVEV